MNSNKVVYNYRVIAVQCAMYYQSSSLILTIYFVRTLIVGYRENSLLLIKSSYFLSGFM